ncbi:hypothetical protein CDAR_178621 [Caerostris darwini]|uniref:Uncharacterized protein n=1 Tax=Caerostris darwini TaxID=1538125 RepID=A0AAV4PG26_9ARAC|nr:hypothetical protein CDAR_178621 [Caerostris darwini]
MAEKTTSAFRRDEETDRRGQGCHQGNAIALLYLAKYEMNQPVIGVRKFSVFSFRQTAPDIWGRRGEWAVQVVCTADNRNASFNNGASV